MCVCVCVCVCARARVRACLRVQAKDVGVNDAIKDVKLQVSTPSLYFAYALDPTPYNLNPNEISEISDRKSDYGPK